MINPFHEVNWQPGLPERRKFAVSLLIGFPCVALAFFLLNRFGTGAWHPAPFLRLGIGGFSIGLVLWLLPQIAKPCYLLWYGIACTMGLVIANLLFSLVFYLILTPLGLMMRASGRDALHKRFDRSAKSYWRKAETVADVTRYYRQF